jgi:hypothetical protein
MEAAAGVESEQVFNNKQVAHLTKGLKGQKGQERQTDCTNVVQNVFPRPAQPHARPHPSILPKMVPPQTHFGVVRGRKHLSEKPTPPSK